MEFEASLLCPQEPAAGGMYAIPTISACHVIIIVVCVIDHEVKP
jgi:hypothetical protein